VGAASALTTLRPSSTTVRPESARWRLTNGPAATDRGRASAQASGQDRDADRIALWVRHLAGWDARSRHIWIVSAEVVGLAQLPECAHLAGAAITASEKDARRRWSALSGRELFAAAPQAHG
jgi:hypothetical protein